MKQSTINWAYLIHLGFKMWPYWDKKWGINFWKDDPNMDNPDILLCEKQTWDEVVLRLRDAGCNMLIIDIAEGLQYDTHPELAVKGSWSKDELKNELDKLRSMGITPVPKLNFSAGHSEWLGKYNRIISTPLYYEVVSDLIGEVAELFGNTGYFHIGMDEEKEMPLNVSQYIVIRKFDLWWHDFNYICDLVRKAGCTPMMWPDMFWKNKEDFIRNMPKDVIISNWYYDKFDDVSIDDIAAYTWLQENGYTQMPTGSTFFYDSQFVDTVRYCREIVTPDLLFGYMQTPWMPTSRYAMDHHLKAIDALSLIRREMT